jgi:hypothetical protein
MMLFPSLTPAAVQLLVPVLAVVSFVATSIFLAYSLCVGYGFRSSSSQSVGVYDREGV